MAGGVGVCLLISRTFLNGPPSYLHGPTRVQQRPSCSLLPPGFALSLPLSLVSTHDLDLRLLVCG